MKELKVGQVIISKQGENSDNYAEFKRIVKGKNIEENLNIEILWPKEEQISENILNNNSIVCKLNYQNFSCIFTGDIEEIAERKILEEYKNNLKILNSTILKVGHHGSKTSSIEEFTEVINPKIALIGVGENNKFGHPNIEVIKRLEALRYKNI